MQVYKRVNYFSLGVKFLHKQNNWCNNTGQTGSANITRKNFNIIWHAKNCTYIPQQKVESKKYAEKLVIFLSKQ